MSTRIAIPQAKPAWKISVINRNGALLPSTGFPTASDFTTVGSANRIAGLADVNLTETPPVNGSTLVYNSATGKYDVEILPSLDGGSF